MCEKRVLLSNAVIYLLVLINHVMLVLVLLLVMALVLALVQNAGTDGPSGSADP